MTQQKLLQRQRCVADGAFRAEQPDFGTLAVFVMLLTTAGNGAVCESSVKKLRLCPERL